jgi:hypothetical protein
VHLAKVPIFPLKAEDPLCRGKWRCACRDRRGLARGNGTKVVLARKGAPQLQEKAPHKRVKVGLSSSESLFHIVWVFLLPCCRAIITTDFEYCIAMSPAQKN